MKIGIVVMWNQNRAKDALIDVSSRSDVKLELAEAEGNICFRLRDECDRAATAMKQIRRVLDAMPMTGKGLVRDLYVWESDSSRPVNIFDAFAVVKDYKAGIEDDFDESHPMSGGFAISRD